MENNLSKIFIKVSGYTVICLSACLFTSVPGFADGDWEETPRRRVTRPAPVQYKEPVRQEEPPVVYREPVAERPVYRDEDAGWMTRLSAGTPVWFFEEEDTEVGGGIYLDFWNENVPLNYRIGAEVRHLTLNQDSAQFAREWFDKETQVTYVRVPIAVEYMHSFDDTTTLYVGGGPDIINVANDISDTSVGMHLGGRVHFALDRHWGLAVEGGYMWGSVDGEGQDVEFDGAFVIPTVAYTF